MCSSDLINVDDFRRSGYLPEVVCNFLALNGWSPGENREKFDNAFLAQVFDLPRVVKTPAKFDRVKLLSFNCDAITGMPREDFVRRARAHGETFHPEFMRKLTPAQFEALAGASHERSKTLDDLFRGNRFLVLGDDAFAYDAKAAEKNLKAGEPSGVAHLKALRPLLAEVKAYNLNASGLGKRDIERSRTVVNAAGGRAVPVEVPYMFCSDGEVGANLLCKIGRAHV